MGDRIAPAPVSMLRRHVDEAIFNVQMDCTGVSKDPEVDVMATALPGQFKVGAVTNVAGVPYYIHPHHRGSSRRKVKSKWSVAPEEEIRCFLRSRIRAWLREEDGWGLHVVDGALILLGTVPGGIETKIAKFEFGSGPDWHGYPANPMRKADVPPARLLGSWVKDNLIKKYQMARLLRGTPCGL